MTTAPTCPPPVVFARIIDGPLTAESEAALLPTKLRDSAHRLDTVSDAPPGLVGATLRFEGVVRRSEPDPHNGGVVRHLTALHYQTYDPMAERQLLALARDITARHRLSSLVTLHSRGRVDVGDVSFVLIVHSPHRAEALAAMTDFIDRLKQDVPIWKRPVWEERPHS